MNQGWFKIHRVLFDKPIWLLSTPQQKVVLITILGMANFSENKWEWKGRPCSCLPGQFITSLEGIQRRCGRGVSIQNIRTAIKRLETYGFLTNETTKTNRLITICNWETYQNLENETNKETNSRLTNSRQTADNQLTTNKNVEKDKNEKKEKKIWGTDSKKITSNKIYRPDIEYRSAEKDPNCIRIRKARNLKD